MSIYPRERITEALQDSANRGVAIVVAPAGFGKSEAIRDAFGPGAPVVDLGRDVVSPETISRLVIEAANPRVRRALTPLLQRPETDENRTHLADWCSARLRSIDHPIVFEDFERIAADAATLRFVQRLIESSIPQTRWVIASRKNPALPISTWLARDYMTLPLSTEDLAFDTAEGIGLAQAMGVQIDPSAVTILVAELGEWPLALRLALSSWERTQAIAPLRLRTRGILFDYLQAEVWSLLTENEQRFLFFAAELAEVKASTLAAAGFRDSEFQLEQFDRRLMLLARRGDGSYRLHDLFREFIRDCLKRNPTLHATVVSTLALALEQTSSIDDAIAIQVEGLCWDPVLDLLARFGLDRIMNGNRAGIAAAMRRLPASHQRDHVVAGLRGYMFYLDGLESAELELRFALSGDLDRTFRGTIQLALALYLQSTSRPREATELLRILMADEGLPKDIRVNAAGTLAATYAMSMETALAREAMQFCAGTLELAPTELRALLHHRLSFCHFMFGERPAAESHAIRSVELAQAIGDDRMLSRAYSILSSGACSWDTDTVQALHYTRAMNRASLAAGDRVMLVHGYYVELGLAAENGNDELFVEVERRIGELGASMPHRNIMLIAQSRVIHLLGVGDRAGALHLLRSINTKALRPAERSMWEALLALLLVNDEKEEAKKHLRRPVFAEPDDFDSLRIAAFGASYAALARWLLEPGGVRKHRFPSSGLTARDATLVDIMLKIAEAPRRTLTSGQLQELTEPLIRHDFAGHARFLRLLLAPVEVLSAALTTSELNVLRELRRGGTTADVARRTGRSSNTVLVHVRSACSKIGCSGRAAAVAYAVGRGWIE